MLDSSRTELRHCLWDLKSKALEEPTFELALRRSLQQVASFENIELDFNIPRQPVDDPTAHAILSVIRELVANAVNHGLAEHITVQGEIIGEDLVITVSDNGCGFDVSGVGSSDDGHFGLDGIRQRVMRLNGAFTITSQPGSGTSAVIRIPHPFKS
jgi:signal transduction histidine kinase